MKRLNRDAWIGVGVSILGLVAMYFDHLAYGIYDWASFVIGAVLIVGVAGFVFGWLVPRAHADRDVAGKLALVLGLVTIPVLVFTLWIGPPWVLAGGSVALGLNGLGGRHNRRAAAGLVIGLVALLACLAGSDWTNST